MTIRRGAGFLANDPLEYPRRYSHPRDREVAAFISAALAYGRVASIRNSLETLFALMGSSPARFVADFDPRRDGARLAGFKHRFNTGRDIACLCWLLRGMLEEAGSLEGFFRAGDDPGSPDIGPGLAAFCRRALALDVSPLYGRPDLPVEAGVRYFFPSPQGGSACKRLCMFLRWVCRPDDGLDLGLWTGVAPSRLVVPLDTHTARISRLLGLSRRKGPGWKMALEVTESLRRLDPTDPVRYDFALAHLGISEGCTGRRGEWCVACPVAGMCSVDYRE
ncbi:TIGR02757 family protein [Desulfuromonas sp.]|uniref:TIGR02757 family protein n=1 Tax=Desulfuromonas sp. TaxID=892 RepID=UPI0025B8964F|nr:TIGR02757 family protein [Desulfuromonas sp.]